ncbi:GNAT family N-acetyltransferase [Mycoplasmatota bacterium]|nr:GNAT family N-acetyltransferase [Mycoplasmatota bacterium]
MNIELAVLENQLIAVKDILESNNLSFDDDIDLTLIAVDKEIIGTVSISGNIIKCLSVLEKHQGKGVATALVNKVIKYLETKDIYHYFAYSKEDNYDIFTGLGMKEVVTVDSITLFEGGVNNISDYLLDIKEKYHLDKEYASIVMNLNPLTNGHLYLIEKASKENENVLVFVVEEDKSEFPFKFRYELCKRVAKRFSNVTVIPSTVYMISKATFSTYFIKDKGLINELFAKIDFEIFKKYFVKIFNIKKRYIGTEPICAVTNSYNKVMLSDGFEVILVERKKLKDKYISASIVRELLKIDINLIKEYVPRETYEMLNDFRS